MTLFAILSLLLILNPLPGKCQPNKPGPITWERAVSKRQSVTVEMLRLLSQYKGSRSAPTIGDLKMPEGLWWMVQVASECTDANPALVASVMRFESDFRCGLIGKGVYVGPMGIKLRPFEDKFPIHEIFGNVLTGARRLAQFSSVQAALAGYNKDRSPAYSRYCNSVRSGVKRMGKINEPLRDDPAWRAAVVLGGRVLTALELHAAQYDHRRN